MQNFIPAQTGLNHETELLIKQSRDLVHMPAL